MKLNSEYDDDFSVLKEFKTEIEKLKNNSSDLEIKKLAEQIYNEIK